jgi:drug/metabolite transporter (DMT)-like permease
MIFSKRTSSISLHWQGAIWKILACFFFAANNGVVKLLSQASAAGPALSSYQIAFLQNFIGFIIMLPFILPKGKQKLKIVYPSLHFYRVLTAVAGIVLWYMALSHMQMAEAVALSFTGPIFTVIGAHFYLRERIGFYRSIGIILGILGAFVITRPDRALWGGGESSLSWIVLLPLGSAIGLAAAKLFGRELGAKGESAENLTFYLLLFMAPLSLIPALAVWIMPAPEQWYWVILLGALSASAHYSTSHAYKAAEVTFLAPFGFARLMFTAAIGFVAFAEIPNSLSLWIGTGVIIIGTLCLTLEKNSLFLRPKGMRETSPYLSKS